MCNVYNIYSTGHPALTLHYFLELHAECSDLSGTSGVGGGVLVESVYPQS